MFSAVMLFAEDSATVDLSFRWQDGMSLLVERQFERQTSIGRKKESISSSCRYVWRVQKAGSEYHIRFGSFEELVKEPAPRSKDPVVLLEYLSRKIEPILPTLVIDSNAQPMRLDNMEVVKQMLKKEIDTIPAGSDSQFQQFRNILMNEESIKVRAFEDWNRMIQVWSGNVGAEIGGSFETTGITGHAAGKPIESVFTYTVSRSAKPNTVQLSITQKPKTGDAKAVLDALLGVDFFQTLGITNASELVFENRFTTVSDPSTLIPLTYQKVKTWGAYVGADKAFQGRKDTWSFTFKAVKAVELKGAANGSQPIRSETNSTSAAAN
jgi:hypothetical protein